MHGSLLHRFGQGEIEAVDVECGEVRGVFLLQFGREVHVQLELVIGAQRGCVNADVRQAATSIHAQVK